MDSVNRNPMQQQVSVAVLEVHRLEAPPNRQPLVMIPTPNRISTGEEAQPKTSQSMVTSGTSSLYQYHHGTVASNPSPAASNSLALFARAIPSSMQTLSRPHTDQNFSLTRFNPYAKQLGLTSTSYGPQIDPKVNNSISSRPHANWHWHDTFPNGKHQPVPFASMSRPHDYLANISNNTSGVGSSSTPAVRGASTYPPTRSFYLPAYTHQQQLPEPWSFQQQRIPSIYEDQLRKYLYHWNRRPKDNNITFWREFVNEYYAPDGKRKCCLSAWTDYITAKYRKWKDKSPCDHCRTYSQYGYDISYEELPIYFQYKFNTLKSETLKLRSAFKEFQLQNQNTVLYFEKVSEEAMDDLFFTVQEGPLAVTFTFDKKILSWQLCVRNCEKLAARSDLLPSRVNGMLRNAGDSSGASGSKSDQQWTKENCSMINIKTGCELAKKLKENKFYDLGPSTQVVQTNMINNLPKTMKNSKDIYFGNQYGTDSLQNCTSQQTSGHQIQSQSLSCIISQTLGANERQVNLLVPQFLHPPSVLDTSASSCRLGTGTESSSINSTGTTSPLCMASTVNATSMPGPSDPTVNLLKRTGTTENGLFTDHALLRQRVTRQQLGADTLISRDGVTTGSGDWNLTPSLVVDQNMGSSANLLDGFGSVNLEDRQLVDYILEGTDLDNYLTDIAILEDLLKQ